MEENLEPEAAHTPYALSLPEFPIQSALDFKPGLSFAPADNAGGGVL
jgi:hypothetical protein